jgi:hypothetical protein
MDQSAQLSNRIREVFSTGLWIANTNYKKALANVTFEQATKKNGDLNTIAALTFHINYYVAGLNTVFAGGTLDIKDKYSFDLSPLKNEAEWKILMNSLLSNAETFAKHVENMSDKKLQSVFVDPKYGTYQRNIEAIIEHAYYHLGQIVLLKNLVINNHE